MEQEIKDILLSKLKEKNVRKFNGFTLGLHANHIANAILRKKGVKKGSSEHTTQLAKIKQMVKDIHKELPAQEVTAKAKAPANKDPANKDPAPANKDPAPANKDPEMSPAQLARETSSVQDESTQSDLQKAKSNLKRVLKEATESDSPSKELTDKVQDAIKSFNKLKNLETLSKGLKVAVSGKRVVKALKEGVKKMRETKVKKEEKPKTLTTEQMKERFAKAKEALSKKAEKASIDIEEQSKSMGYVEDAPVNKLEKKAGSYLKLLGGYKVSKGYFYPNNKLAYVKTLDSDRNPKKFYMKDNKVIRDNITLDKYINDEEGYIVKSIQGNYDETTKQYGLNIYSEMKPNTNSNIIGISRNLILNEY